MGKSPIYLTADGEDQWGMDVDVYDSAVPGGVTDEFFDITIQSRLKNPELTSDFADVILQEYQVTYYRTDGNASVPAPFMMHMQMTVPAGGELTINALVLRRDAKLRTPLKELVFGGGEGYIGLNAAIEFFGEDLMGNQHKVRYILHLHVADN
jgi:hypothetical protein